MKLRNKTTGEIGELQITEKHCAVAVGNGTASGGIVIYSSLAGLNEEWEDYEEPKEAWYIENAGDIKKGPWEWDEYDKRMLSIGNYFGTKEEAEKAVEKLKAWKRLRDKGFKFNCWYGGSKDMSFSIPQERIDRTTAKDLDLLFGGEE